jgi:hypothetical protein
MTVSYQVVYWREIPAQIKLRLGRQRLARPLSDRFQRAIDAAAMRAGLSNSDVYLAEWRADDWQTREGELGAVADALVAELEAQYDSDRLAALARGAGTEALAPGG